MAEMVTRTHAVIFGSRVLQATVTNNPADVRRWLRQTRSRLDGIADIQSLVVVGLGVQWIPGGGAGAATLQLSAGYNCLIYHLHQADDVPISLRLFLTDPDVIFVGVWNYMDAAMLRESRHRLVVDRLVDLRDVARDVRGLDRNTFTGELVSEILGIEGMEGDEAVLRSNWEAEDLTAEQARYACCDAFIAFEMGIQLRVWEWAGN